MFAFFYIQIQSCIIKLVLRKIYSEKFVKNIYSVAIEFKNLKFFFFLQVNDFSLEYVTHDDAVKVIAGIVEEFNEIVLRVGKVTQYTAQNESNLR